MDNNTQERADVLDSLVSRGVDTLTAIEISAVIDEVVMTLSMTSTLSISQDICEYITELQKIDTAAKDSGYSEILKASQWCQVNLALFKENPSEQIDAFIESGECWSWLELISAFLDDPEEESYESSLSDELLRDEWLECYEDDDVLELLLQLATPSDFVSDTGTPYSSSLSFTWDEGTHPELIEALFEEATELVSLLGTILQQASKKELDSDGRYNASRLAHTLKGGSATTGITALSTFSYRLEKILEYSVKHELADDIYPLLGESASCLEDLFQAVKENTGEPKSFAAVFTQLSDYAETLEEDVEPLTLGKPKLPDFITQKTTSEPASESSMDESFDANEIDESVDENIDESKEVSDLSAYAELDEAIMTLSTISTTQETAYTKYKKELQHLSSWAETSGFSAIEKAAQWCQQNLIHFENNNLDKSAFIESGESWLWLEFISACLSDPEESSHLADLTTELMREEWVQPFETDDLQNLLMQLKNSHVGDETSEESSDESSYEKSDVDTEAYKFSWDADIHPELLSSYMHETPDQISKVASLLIKISKGNANKAEHQQACRIAHTIKGASGVVGVTALVEFTHKLEDILGYSINHQLPEEIAILLAESSDCLEDTFDAIQNKEEAPQEFEELLDKLSQFSETLEQDDLIDESLFDLSELELPDFIINDDELATSEPQVDISTVADESSEEVVGEVINSVAQQDENLAASPANQEPDFSALVGMSGVEQISAEDRESQELSDADSYIRVPVDLIDRLLNLVGELVTTSTQVADKIDKSIVTSKQIKVQDSRVHEMLDELGTTLLKQEKEQQKVIASLQNSDFDHLEMDTYNELYSISGLLTESILDGEAIEANLERQLQGLKNDLYSLDRLNNDLSDVILSSRMVSINSLIPRLERIVRQTRKKTKKKVKLVVSGNEINIDTEILNGLTDPLLHLLRNAVDHGIEYPVDRKKAKKGEVGKIKLEFSKHGNHIQLLLQDDGAGIDAEKIHQKAIEKGLINSDQVLGKDEKLQLILHAGFSTQESVTDISGRGVGMDVVNNAVQSLNGTLNIDSEPGKGTTFTINIPLTLVTSATLLVNISGYQVAIPSESIEQLHYLAPETVIEREQGYFVRLDDTEVNKGINKEANKGDDKEQDKLQKKELPIHSLATLIGFPAVTPDFTKSHTLLFVKTVNDTHAIYIDEIISSRQVVIKNLSDWLDTSEGLIGACHLPDGGVAPVINLSQILTLNEKTNQVIRQIQLDSNQSLATEKTAKILVVDDSLSNRKALSLIIAQTDYDVVTAVDGLDALQIMNENDIDLVFTDLEMPRMNGVELTQAIRVWDEKKETPIVMITSRTTNKHRQLAEKAGVNDYLTKPVLTETLLDSIHQWLQEAAV